jgi:hypothetical protein
MDMYIFFVYFSKNRINRDPGNAEKRIRAIRDWIFIEIGKLEIESFRNLKSSLIKVNDSLFGANLPMKEKMKFLEISKIRNGRSYLLYLQ